MNCSLCNNGIPQARIDMGYTICTNCSTEDKVSCHTIYPHKTGGYIQVVSKEQSENLNRLDRRGVGGIKTAKHYKEFKMNSSGDIPLATRVKIQDIVTDKYLTPSPRTLMRHFNNKQVGIK